MKVTRLKSGGFLSSGTDAGDLAILRKAKNIDDGSGMKAGGAVKNKNTGSDLTVEEIRRIQKRINEGKTRIPSNLQRMQKNMKEGGRVKKSRVNEAGNYTKPGLRKSIFNRIKAGGKGGRPGQWSARKAQMMAKAYKKAGGGYK
jgi:hypothetical protein